MIIFNYYFYYYFNLVFVLLLHNSPSPVALIILLPYELEIHQPLNILSLDKNVKIKFCCMSLNIKMAI